MKKIPKKKYKKLIKKHCLIDQTAFIEDLLQNDYEMKYLNHLKNINWYEAKLSTGKFKGTDIHYYKLLKDLQSKLDMVETKQQKQLIRKDIRAVENSYKGERIVRKWYAVPPRLARELEAKSMVVLYSLGAYWLGDCKLNI